MRPLDENETTLVFNKLHVFVGNNLKNIALDSQSHEGPDANPGRYCFRLQKNRVYYVSDSLVKRATNIKREKLVSLGTQIGKFTKAGKFHLTVQCLNLLAANAKHKVWLKPTSEMSFLYGNSVLKGGVGRITENIQVNDGVVVFSMADMPLGFGVAAKSTVDCRKMDPNGIVVHRHADIGIAVTYIAPIRQMLDGGCQQLLHLYKGFPCSRRLPAPPPAASSSSSQIWTNRYPSSMEDKFPANSVGLKIIYGFLNRKKPSRGCIEITSPEYSNGGSRPCYSIYS